MNLRAQTCVQCPYNHSNHEPITLTDTKDRHIIVPADALGYAIIGSETRHAVGFGALN